MIKIRLARLADEEAVLVLLSQFPNKDLLNWDKEASGKAFRKIVHNSDLGTVFIAEEEGAVLGVLTLSYPTAVRCGGIYTCIEEFIVDENGRGKGIGGSLMKAALIEASSRGCFELQVNDPSPAGYPVYLKYGLKDIGKHLKIKIQ
jgi:predicted N-acetyltransferase YhbS